MERGEDVWMLACSQAQGFLRRFGDDWTRSHREDLVQETAIAAWKWSEGVHDPARFWAAVRTIARRVRCRALTDAHRDRAAKQALKTARGDAREESERYYVIGDRRVPSHRVRPCMQRALDRLRPLDRQLLLGFHEGFCCAELSVRCARSEQCVKTRIHRARRRVQMEVEACVRAAGGLDEE